MNEPKTEFPMKKHILCIDDEADIRGLLKDILTVKGYRISVAASAEEAIRILETDRPQLIIADLQLADTDGLVLIKELKQLAPDAPVLLLAGVIFDAEVSRDTICKEVSSYLSKTTSLNEIVSEIRRLLGEAAVEPSPPA